MALKTDTTNGRTFKLRMHKHYQRVSVIEQQYNICVYYYKVKSHTLSMTTCLLSMSMKGIDVAYPRLWGHGLGDNAANYKYEVELNALQFTSC